MAEAGSLASATVIRITGRSSRAAIRIDAGGGWPEADGQIAVEAAECALYIARAGEYEIAA